VLDEEKLSVGRSRDPGAEATRGAELCLRLDLIFVLLPLLAVGRVRELVMEALGCVLVVGEGAPELDVLGVAAVLAANEEVGLADSPGLGVDLLAEQEDVEVLVDTQKALLADVEQAARAAARVTELPDEVLLIEHVLVLGDQQLDHQSSDLAWGEVLARVL